MYVFILLLLITNFIFIKLKFTINTLYKINLTKQKQREMHENNVSCLKK